MSKFLKLSLLILLFIQNIVSEADAVPRKSRPWPEINLSILPSVVGMSNSWAFEINRRSAAYLSDLDKLHLAVSYGRGRNENDITALSGQNAGRYGYRFYSGIDYSIDNFRLDVYSTWVRRPLARSGRHTARTRIAPPRMHSWLPSLTGLMSRLRSRGNLSRV